MQNLTEHLKQFYMLQYDVPFLGKPNISQPTSVSNNGLAPIAGQVPTPDVGVQAQIPLPATQLSASPPVVPKVQVTHNGGVVSGGNSIRPPVKTPGNRQNNTLGQTLLVLLVGGVLVYLFIKSLDRDIKK